MQAEVLTGSELVVERSRCERAILAARDDAAAYGIDATRVAFLIEHLELA